MTGLAREMVHAATRILGKRSQAVRLVRVILRHFGGQLIYLPVTPRSSGASKYLESLRGLVADEIGDGDADRFVEHFANLFGGCQLYMPLEFAAFRDEICDEVFRRYDGTQECMADLCREYNTSYVNIYRWYHRGRDRNVRQPELFDIKPEADTVV